MRSRGFWIYLEGGAKGFAAGLDVGRERMRGVKMCGRNNWKDELPYREMEGGEVLPWRLRDDQRSASGMLRLSCSSCIPGRAVEPAAGCMMSSADSLLGISLSDGWALREEKAEEKALECACRAGTCTCYSCVLGLPVTARTGRGWG